MQVQACIHTPTHTVTLTPQSLYLPLLVRTGQMVHDFWAVKLCLPLEWVRPFLLWSLASCVWSKGFSKVAWLQSMKDTARRGRRVIFRIWAQLLLGFLLPCLYPTVSGPWWQTFCSFEAHTTKTEGVSKKKRRQFCYWTRDSTIGFWWGWEEGPTGCDRGKVTSAVR